MQTHITFNNGNKIPTLGLGTWESAPNQVGEAVRFALTKANYRHIDCALIYKNEPEIGLVFNEILDKSIKRTDVFITSKLWNSHHRADYVEKACRKTLADLKLEYLDLYLIHWGLAFKTGDNLRPNDKNGLPITDAISIRETWEAMENLVKKGLVKSIGVANFTTVQLVDLLTYAKIKPAMNQIEIHPYNAQQLLIDYCKNKDIAVTAYSPLGRNGAVDKNAPKLFDEPVIASLAVKYKKTPAQILLNWGVCRGTVVIPKSINAERIAENADIFDFELTVEEQKSINALNRNYRFVDPKDWWGVPYFA